MDFWMDVDVALGEVPVNVLPLLDDTDFVTIEDAIAYNESGMDLNWNFVLTDGSMTHTNVVPTTAGAHDWNHQGNGIYSLEIPASSGTINNDTEGFGWFSGVCDGVLPWRGPIIGFRAAALNNALIDGGDELDVNLTKWLGTAAATPTTAGVPEVDLTHIAGSTSRVTALDKFLDGMNSGAAEGSPTTTVIDTDLTATDAQHYRGQTMVFTTGTLDGQGRVIVDHNNSSGQMTVWPPFTSAPSAADEFVVLPWGLNNVGLEFAVAEAGTLSTTQMTTDLAEATDDHYIGRSVVWVSGVLAGQGSDITDYLGSSGRLTYDDVTEAPSAGDAAVIV